MSRPAGSAGQGGSGPEVDLRQGLIVEVQPEQHGEAPPRLAMVVATGSLEDDRRIVRVAWREGPRGQEWVDASRVSAARVNVQKTEPS